jgi:hypothetical protein
VHLLVSWGLEGLDKGGKGEGGGARRGASCTHAAGWVCRSLVCQLTVLCAWQCWKGCKCVCVYSICAYVFSVYMCVCVLVWCVCVCVRKELVDRYAVRVCAGLYEDGARNVRDYDF